MPSNQSQHVRSPVHGQYKSGSDLKPWYAVDKEQQIVSESHFSSVNDSQVENVVLLQSQQEVQQDGYGCEYQPEYQNRDDIMGNL